MLHPTILADVDPRAARRVRGDLRAGRLDHPVRRPSTRRSRRPTRRRSDWPPASSRRTSPARWRAARRLHVGLLHVNDASSSRVDLMPFGGVKQSGLGREGPKYAMQEMTEERLSPSTSVREASERAKRASQRSERKRERESVGESRGEALRKMTGAMFIAHCLKQEGVTKVFGQCGHTNYALIDACHRLGSSTSRSATSRWRRMPPTPTSACRTGWPCVNVHLSPGHDQRDHRRGHRRRRLDADGGDLRQHAVVPPRARAAPGHPLPRRRLAGRHLPAVLQARLAHRRRQVPARRDAARAERGADRPPRRGAARRADGRLLAADRRAEPSPWRAGPNYGEPPAVPTGIAAAAALLAGADGAAHLRRQRRDAVRSGAGTAARRGAALDARSPRR